jgi:hypothetical protein
MYIPASSDARHGLPTKEISNLLNDGHFLAAWAWTYNSVVKNACFDP